MGRGNARRADRPNMAPEVPAVSGLWAPEAELSFLLRTRAQGIGDIGVRNSPLPPRPPRFETRERDMGGQPAGRERWGSDEREGLP